MDNIVKGLFVTVVGGVVVWFLTERNGTVDPPGAEVFEAVMMLQCDESSSTICQRRGATCTVSIKTDQTKNDFCVWSDAQSEARCRQTGGIWTTPSSRYAQNHPDIIPVGQSGICGTEVQNLDN